MEIEYLKFFKLFHEERDYFECHEVMEELWIKETNYATKKHPAITLLLIAVGTYHWKNNNYRGAFKVLQNSLESLKDTKDEIVKIKIEASLLEEKLKQIIEKISKNNEYEEFKIPLIREN